MERRGRVFLFQRCKDRASRNRYSIQRFIMSSYNEELDEASISVISMQYPDPELEMNIKRFKENGLSIFYSDIYELEVKIQ